MGEGVLTGITIGPFRSRAKVAREGERRRGGVGQCFSLIGLTGLFAERKTKLNKGAYPREEIERLSIYNQTRLSDQTWWRVASAFLGNGDDGEN